MALTQAGRHIRVNTNLGEDALFLESFEGDERVSGLFRFELGLLTEDPSFSMDSLLNQPVVVSISLHDDTDRNFHGIINHIEEIETRTEGATLYRATMVPWTWLLTLFNDCRIFQNMAVPDIVQKVFSDRGFSDFANRVTGTYPPREYCVQYRETDFNFISRLLEDEGIFYFFEHDADKHTLVLADQPTAFVACPGQSQLAYDTIPGLWQDEDVVLSLRPSAIRAGRQGHRERLRFHQAHHLSRRQSGCQPPGEYLRISRQLHHQGRWQPLCPRAPRRAGSQAAHRQRGNQLPGFVPRLPVHAQRLLNATTPIRPTPSSPFITRPPTTATSRTTSRRPSTTATPSKPFRKARPYHPPRISRRPFIQGAQTAVVVGKSGEEIWVDQYGRVKVQFFWDRAGTMDENSSCWIRVAQVWAGKGWGAIFTPRIGQEVIVDFLEGDPDRPIITGRVYNADQTVPYTLPDNQTKSTIKSMSSKGGGGFNEIRLEDKAGSEQVFIYGQKDQDIRILNDVREWVGEDRNLIITRDRKDQTGRDDHDDIGRDHIEKIGRDHHLTISGKEAISITGSHSLQVQGDVIEAFSGNQSTAVTQNLYISGMQVVIQATTGMTLSVGGNFITIDATGVTIFGTMVNINSGGSPFPAMPVRRSRRFRRPIRIRPTPRKRARTTCPPPAPALWPPPAPATSARSAGAAACARCRPVARHRMRLRTIRTRRRIRTKLTGSRSSSTTKTAIPCPASLTKSPCRTAPP